MALIYCRPIAGRSGSSAGLFETEMQRSWQIKVSSKTDNIYLLISLLQSSGDLPYYLARHPDNLFASCRKMSVRDDASGMVYTVTADYSTKPLTQDEKERSEQQNPLDRRPRIWLETTEYEIATDKTRDGKGICTSAGSKFPEPAYIPASDYLLQVRQNFSDWPEWAEDYHNKLNENALLIRPSPIANLRTLAAETVLFKFKGCSEPKEENGVMYVEASFTLHYRRDGWRHSPMDEDLYYLDSGDRKRITVDDEDAVTPQPLDGEGGILANPTTDNVVFLDYDIIPTADMTELESWGA